MLISMIHVTGCQNAISGQFRENKEIILQHRKSQEIKNGEMIKGELPKDLANDGVLIESPEMLVENIGRLVRFKGIDNIELAYMKNPYYASMKYNNEVIRLKDKETVIHSVDNKYGEVVGYLTRKISI